MLQHLQIQNYALIESLSVDFSKGFSVITGETGAGKSILLGALGFVLGDRADTNILFDKEKKCVVEAVFTFEDETLKPLFEANDIDFDPSECIFRREFNPQKKSRAFINDTPVALQTMKAIGRQLVDIHSQHDSLLLTDSDFQLRLLDEIAQNETRLLKYQTEYKEVYHVLIQMLKDLRERATKDAAEHDYLKFQLDELQKAELKEGEYTEIEQTLHVMENAEEIKTLLMTAKGLIEDSDNALISQANDLASTLQRMRQLLPDTGSLGERVENLRIELKDIAYDLRQWENETQFEEEELLAIQGRYDLLNRLMMKHRLSDFDALVNLRDELQKKVNAYDKIDETIARREDELKTSERTLSVMAKILHDQRSQAAVTFGKKVTELARQLAMPFAVFNVEINPVDAFGPTGRDSIHYLFSANKGITPAELDKVASGGELSRLMLAIKSTVSDYNYIPTLIFDEIDTGVSGEVAAKIGSIMRQMGEKLQLISITHLPQVASQAEHHFFIYKDNQGVRTQSHIKQLNADERVTEIAKMLSNDKVSPEALKAAEVLLVRS